VRPRAALKRDTGDKTELSSKRAYLTVIYRNFIECELRAKFNSPFHSSSLKLFGDERIYFSIFRLQPKNINTIFEKFYGKYTVLCKFLTDKKSSYKLKKYMYIIFLPIFPNDEIHKKN
jgi:hypothetical protein